MHYEVDNSVLLIFRGGAPEPPIFITMRFAAICNAMVNHGITQSILLSVFVGLIVGGRRVCLARA